MSSEAVVRGALVQDLGRAARHIGENSQPATILVSSILENQLNTKVRKKGQRKGILRLPPDYPHCMKKPTAKELGKEVDKEIYPSVENDLKVYSKWSAGMKREKDKETKEWKEAKHYDHGNSKQYKNRFLLSAPPQSGKTGVYLQLGRLIWESLGEPAHVSPAFETIPEVEIETFDVDEVTAEEKVQTITPEHFEEYPKSQHIKTREFKKAMKNIKYGNASYEELHHWYIVEHNQNPHPSVYDASRNTRSISRSESLAGTRTFECERSTTEKKISRERNYNKSSARSLEKLNRFDFSEPENMYEIHCHSL